jgi:hypothetical protein
MNIRKQELLDDQDSKRFILAQIEESKKLCKTYARPRSYLSEDNLLLKKMHQATLLGDKFSRLTQLFGTTDFINQFNECSEEITSPGIMILMNEQRITKNSAEDANGKILLLQLEENLKSIREMYLDLFVPENIQDVKRLFIRRMKIKTEAFDAFLKKSPESNSRKAKQEIVDAITKIINSMDKVSFIADSPIQTIKDLITAPETRAIMLYHGIGRFLANIGGLAPSDEYLKFADKQITILHQRTEIINAINYSATSYLQLT